MTNPHMHSATVTVGRVVRRPYHAQCSCGTAGDFATRPEAIDFIQTQHFAKLGGITETNLKVVALEGAKALDAPVTSPAHVPGVGVMPSSHAPGPARMAKPEPGVVHAKPPAPPAPPDQPKPVKAEPKAAK